MNIKHTLASAAALIALGLTSAQAMDIKQPTQGKFKVTSVTLAIKSPATNTCPADGKLMAWIKTNKAGTVDYFFAKKGHAPGQMKQAQAIKTNSGYMVILNQTLTAHQPIDTEYRLMAKGISGGYKMSNWVSFKANCKIGLGGNNELLGG